MPAFQAEMRRRIDQRRRGPAGASEVAAERFNAVEAGGGLVFHDGNDRSVEQLMTEQAKNALQHNLAVELLRKQFALFDLALRERLA